MKDKQIEEMRIQRKLEMTKDISNGIKGVLSYEIQKLAEHLISLDYVKLTEDSMVMTREKYLNKLIEQYEMGIKDSKMHYEYIAIPHIIQSIKENPDIDDAGIEELIKQINIEVKEQNER